MEYFLGMWVQQDLDLGTFWLTQCPYWEHILLWFNLDNVTPRNVPLPPGIILDSDMSPKTESEKREMKDNPYHLILSLVIWGQLATCLDLSFSVSLLARFQANLGIEHWWALMHVIGYIKNTIDYGLTYSCEFDLSPSAFVDTDYGGCRDTRRSTSGYVFTMAGGAVTWSSKWQATISLSTVKAEYVALSRCGQQMVWMHSWLNEVDIKYSQPGVIKGDSHGAITLTMKYHGKIKHIDIQHHYIWELIQSGTIQVKQIPSADNLVDLFTKSLPHDHHHWLLTSLNISPFSSMGECWIISRTAYHVYHQSIILIWLTPYTTFYFSPFSLHSLPTFPPFIYSCIHILTIYCNDYSQSLLPHQLRVSLAYTSYFHTFTYTLFYHSYL